MHIFVTGGSGQTGPAVVSELLAGGHTVTGLARSEAAAARLKALGAVPYRGSLEDLGRLRDGAADADGILHMAYAGDFADPESMMRRDRSAIETLGEALEHSGKPLVITSGTLVLPPGRESTERDEPDQAGIAAFRIAGERACLDFAARGVRAVVVRLAPTVHGPRDHGFIPALIATAREAGVSAYVGDGANRWPAVHRLDAAVLFRLAVEKAPAGSVLHGAAEKRRLQDHRGDDRPGSRPAHGITDPRRGRHALRQPVHGHRVRLRRARLQRSHPGTAGLVAIRAGAAPRPGARRLSRRARTLSASRLRGPEPFDGDGGEPAGRRRPG